LFLLITYCTLAQKVQEPNTSTSHPDWSKPYQPFRIVGNLYYVGTYDLACYLITTPKGNILINTGLADSEKQIKSNIETLGFRFADTKILLNTQAHYDHLGAMAAIKKKTKANLFLNEKDAEVSKDGGKSDYALGGETSTFAPIIPDRLLKDSATIKLGNMKLIMLHHPGHTKGSCSYLFTVLDAQKSYKVLIANMPTIVTDSSFDSISGYKTIANDYAYSLKAMKNITFDIWLASHASQFGLHTKHQPGEAYNPSAFVDKAGYEASLNDLQKDFDEKIKKK
jgi:metallo-beta-lactamase class B